MATDVSMSRPSRMTDDRRQQLDRLLAKPTLTEVEKGQLQDLRRNADQAGAEQATAKLGTGSTSSSGGRVDPEFARKLGEKVGRNIARYLDEGA